MAYRPSSITALVITASLRCLPDWRVRPRLLRPAVALPARPAVTALAAIWRARKGPYNSIVARLVRGNAYARLSYDVTPDIEIYASAIYSAVVTWDKPTQSYFKS